MNKTAIKNFAIWARRKLIADISYKAGLMGITEAGIKKELPQSRKDMQFFDIGTKEPYAISGTEIEQRRRLIDVIESHAGQSDHNAAFRNVIEEVAYTWFNRLIAVRFMEVNDYLPSHIRVLSSESTGKTEPDLVTRPFDAELNFTAAERELIINMQRDNKLDELFRLLFIKQCNALNGILPELFEKTNDYTELLMNVSFTDRDGVVWHLLNDISENEFDIKKEGQVEIIGWLYQYYNTELKDETFDLLKKNVKITKDRIPSATQLFTPDWIVRYMVENSLGRLWINRLESSFGNTYPSEYVLRDANGNRTVDVLKSNWKHYLEEAEQTEDVEFQMEKVLESSRGMKPEDIKLIDPCMGSGHILVYAFDVLMQIYKSCGYSEIDAARLIVEKNLYGLDIDKRAYQLAYFAVMMKARQYDRRFLTRGISSNLCAIMESNEIGVAYKYDMGDFLLEKEQQETLNYMLEAFFDAKEYGSILNIENRDYETLEYAWRMTTAATATNINLTLWFAAVQDAIPQYIKQARILTRKYDVVVTNPPYMGSIGMSGKLSDYAKLNYPDSKSDLSTIFMEKTLNLCKPAGYMAMINIPVWMFISSYEKLRKNILMQNQIINMLHFGRGIFGSDFGSTSFVIGKTHLSHYIGLYRRLFEKQGAVDSVEQKEQWFFNGMGRYTADSGEFAKIPGSPVAYWVSSKVLSAFMNPNLEKIAEPRHGLATSNNELFLKLWFEIAISKASVFDKTNTTTYKWFPMNKGGSFRRWYGNNEWLINYEHDGYEIKRYASNIYKSASRTIQNTKYYFKESITWSALTSGSFSVRWSDVGAIFGSGGYCAFVDGRLTYYILGLMNSKITTMFLKIISPTLNFEVGHIKTIPVIISKTHKSEVDTLVSHCIQLSQLDWDSFETSWDFKQHPLFSFQHSVSKAHILSNASQKNWYIKSAYEAWEYDSELRFEKLKANEEELNRIFIEIYNLQNELTPEVEDKDVTVRKADLGRDIRSFISYAVGCMFGRFSLDQDGLILAGGEWKYSTKTTTDIDDPELEVFAEYNEETGEKAYKSHIHWVNQEKFKSFPIDIDNVIPITDMEYFPDDIVGRLVDFVSVVYGKDTLEDNLYFIASALGNKGDTPREVIRSYFLNDFFKDHCKVYQKRPIYWLFDSGKENGFKALVYMHRYGVDTVGNLRIEYLHRMQRIFESEISRMQETIDNSTVQREVAAATKRREKLIKQLKETKDYDEKIAHLALSRISIDLDSGVKVNYEKVQTAPDGKRLEVLAQI